ncbi:MAG TPA: glycosyltransferase family 4 protein [Vicinamibacterales bacterium]|jgi:glycosyltransferase involved in cell wall biosynthesis|nr:glycosyltransferase family 4 protein [Vicinamibacterales bacterium]
MNMRVLFAIHGPADERTAVYRAVQHRVDALREHGHHADLLAAGDLRGRGPARLDPLLLAPALTRRKLARYDAVVFHSHLGWAFHAARPWLDPDRRVVTVTSFHGLEPIYYAALGRELARRGTRLSARYRLLHGQVVPGLLRFSCRQSDAVFCLNTHEVQYLTSHAWAAPERIYRLGNGVEADCFMDRGPAARVRRLLFVGQWLPAKGTRDLVEAFAALAGRADLELACVGTGAPESQVLADFPETVRGRVRVRPRVDRSALHAELAHADLFVFPTLSEGFSNALLEAMAASLPIVATPVGAAVDLLRDGVNAAIVPAADAPALTARIESLLQQGDVRAALGRAAQATAHEYEMRAVNVRFVERLMHVMEWRPAAHASPWPGGRHVEG